MSTAHQATSAQRGAPTVPVDRGAAPRRRKLRKAPANYLLPPASFRQLLLRERMRTDRTGSPFCVLAFPLQTTSGAQHNPQQLANLLSGWLRFTDQAGFLSDDVLAVFLPDTPLEGGSTVLELLRREHGEQAPPLECDAYLYPGQLLPLDEGAAPNAMQSATALYERSTGLWSRLLDLAVGSVALTAALPILAVAAGAIRFSSPGPIIFSQWRSGRGGRPFRIFKLRTMRTDAEQQLEMLRPLSEQDGPAFKLSNDPRVTSVGRFLRRTSIDELPQLWNVLRGEMSLVGPRPLPLAEQEACLPWQQHRLDVLPGLTGVWQVEGRSEVAFDVWMRMDRDYLRRQSVWTDLRLLWATLPAVLFRRGAK